MNLEVMPVQGIGEVAPGADLAALITGAAPWLRDGDVLVVTSKIVSKAEGRLVELPPAGPDRDRVRAQVLAAETARAVATRGQTRIVATHHGFVMASAGIDASNVEPSWLVLLPKDPDASAQALREALAARHGLRVAVIVSDTMGRPWRNGLTDVALGAAGILPLRDHRGQTDPYGNQLHLTQLAVVDELAAAAELVKGKLDGVPVAVVRGYPAVEVDDGPGVVATLVRDPASDMFPLGAAEARAAGLRAAATLPPPGPAAQPDIPPDTQPGSQPAAVQPAAVQRALATVTAVSSSQLERLDETTIRCTASDPADPISLVQLGTDVHRLCAALAAEEVTAIPAYPAPGAVLLHLTACPSRRQLATLWTSDSRGRLGVQWS